MPTADQINTFIAQPVDKLSTIIGILGVGLVVLLVVFGWQLFKYLSKEDSPIVRAFNGIRDAFNGIKTTNTTVAENLTKVLGATQEQTGVLREQNSLLTDFKNYQKLNNDQVADVGNKVEVLSKSVERNTESIAESIEILKRLEEKIDELTLKHLECSDIKADIAALRKIIEDRQQPPVNAVSVNLLPNASVIDGSEQPQEKAG